MTTVIIVATPEEAMPILTELLPGAKMKAKRDLGWLYIQHPKLSAAKYETIRHLADINNLCLIDIKQMREF